MMTANTARRLRTAVMIMTICIPVSLCYQFFDEGRVSIAGLVVGIVLAMPLALLEESTFDDRMRRLPFTVAVLSKALTYIGSLLAVFMSLGLIDGWLKGKTMQEFWASLADLGFAWKVVIGFGLYVVIVFVRQLDRLLGPGVLLRYLLGRYHRPRREARIFMFVDLKSSTSLAEELGHEAYYGLVNEFFRDISGPVLDNGAEIYEYVGDEVVITWKEKRGIKDAACIRTFFDIDKIIERKKHRYMDRFGVVPEFKAGVHLGEVMTAEIGDLKKGLVFNGDVLNTSSRIQGECNRLGRRFLSSADLLERLTLPHGWKAEEMGPVMLRGKSEPLQLVAFA